MVVNKEHILLWILPFSVELSDKVVKNVDTISVSKKCLHMNKFPPWPLKQRIKNTRNQVKAQVAACEGQANLF